MANDFKDYEELLRYFSDEPKKTEKKPPVSKEKPKTAARTEKPKTAARTEKSEKSIDLSDAIKRSEAARKEKIREFEKDLGSTNDSKPSYRGEVYFSNPPREIKEEAQRQQNAAQYEKTAPKKVSPPPASKKQQQIQNMKAQKKAKRAELISGLINRKKSDGAQGEGSGTGGKKFADTLPSLALTLAIIIFFSVILSVYGLRCVNDILALKADDTAVQVTVSANSSDADVINILKKEGLIRSKLFCKLFIQFKQLGEEPNEYVSGIYTLSEDMGLEKMLSTMQADYTLSDSVSLTFPEGWTVDEIAEKLESNDVCTAASFISTIQSVDFSTEYDFVAQLDAKSDRFRMLEGYLYPDTYDFYVGEPAASVVRRFLDNFESKWTESYQKKADKLGMTVDQVITLASILQKEAANSSQMNGISSVLHNRLDKPATYPWLNCDSTETYLLETIKVTLTSSTEDTEKYIRYRDLYDTYSTECVGLPVGAIANPGDSAINAALNPDDTGYYYFQHDSDGKVYYASTLAEQEQISANID